MPVNPIRAFAGYLNAFARKTRNLSLRRLARGRPFSPKSAKRVLLLTLGGRIPQSQIHPFHVYSDQIQAHHGAEIREITVEKYLASEHPGLNKATTVCFQTDFNISAENMNALIGVIRERNPAAKLVYLDWFAPTDLRLAHMLDPHLDIYVKKHVLSDLGRYGHSTLGDTNLTDYYARRYHLDMPETVFPIPDGFLDKLLVGPSFATADFMLGTFMGNDPLGTRERPIDMHARLSVAGSDWYQMMRSDSLKSVRSVPGLNAVTETGVRLEQYLYELRTSKICFSPFGYGEVCWRDFEAVANGAVLLKPDMSHIRTDPDIFRPGEAYMPLKWDLSDFDEKVDLLLTDVNLRKRLASNAFSILHDYTKSTRFVDQMVPVFS